MRLLGRCASPGIEPMHLVAVPDDRKGIAANVVHARFIRGQLDGGGQHRVSAACRHQQAGA